jgi:hypothetical protein
MIFSPSPALHKIRQLVRLIRNHPEIAAIPDTALVGKNLPDPTRFIDSSMTGNTPGATQADTRQKRSRHPGNIRR